MLVSQLALAIGYPHVQGFIVSLIDMQFADVRAMLQLPRPDIGITPACNFAIVSSLCNLISGISTTIYKPRSLLHEVQSQCIRGVPSANSCVTSTLTRRPARAISPTSSISFVGTH